MADQNQPKARPRAALDFAGFAQEFLRRNPDYRNAWRALAPGSAYDPPLNEKEDMAQQWALSFPRRS